MIEVDCPDCNGTGMAAWEADPRDISGQTPIQVQCRCLSGKVFVSEAVAIEIGALPGAGAGIGSKEERIALLRARHDKENLGHMPNASCVEVEAKIRAIRCEVKG